VYLNSIRRGGASIGVLRLPIFLPPIELSRPFTDLYLAIGKIKGRSFWNSHSMPVHSAALAELAALLTREYALILARTTNDSNGDTLMLPLTDKLGGRDGLGSGSVVLATPGELACGDFLCFGELRSGGSLDHK
jgi:hypothetical protein